MHPFRKIFIGPGTADRHAGVGPYRRIFAGLKAVWNDEREASVGLERLLRLFLCLVQFISPLPLIQSLLPPLPASARGLLLDAFTVTRVLVPLWILIAGAWDNAFLVALNIYLLADTVFSISAYIFLADVHGRQAPFRHSMILLLLDYVQVILAFAVLHLRFTALNQAVSPLGAAYFSIVTAATLGYGDLYPLNDPGRLLVMLQLFVFFEFVTVFINYFSRE